MDRSSKLLGLFTFVIIILGFYLLWSGLKTYQTVKEVQPSASPEQKVESSNFEATTSAVYGIEGEKVYVTKVIDGDTIEIVGGMRVRLIGIDTPETKDPRRPVECFGKEAYLKSKELVEGREVILQKDVSETDKYGRLLRYVYLPLASGQILFLNDYLIREGYATALTYPPDVKFTDQFLEAQQQAKIKGNGLWSRCM